MTAYVSYAVGGHILLSYPSGRLRTARDRVLVALLYLAFGPAIIVCSLFHGDFGPGCPVSPGQRVPDHAERHARRRAQRRLVRGHRGAHGDDGAAVGPALARGDTRRATLARAGLRDPLAARRVDHAVVRVGAAVVFGDVTKPNLVLQVPINIAAMAAAGGILVVFLRSADGGLGRGQARARPRRRAAARGHGSKQAVRSALGDADARLLFRDHAGTSWVDSARRGRDAGARALDHARSTA